MEGQRRGEAIRGGEGRGRNAVRPGQRTAMGLVRRRATDRTTIELKDLERRLIWTTDPPTACREQAIHYDMDPISLSPVVHSRRLSIGLYIYPPRTHLNIRPYFKCILSCRGILWNEIQSDMDSLSRGIKHRAIQRVVRLYRSIDRYSGALISRPPCMKDVRIMGLHFDDTRVITWSPGSLSGDVMEQYQCRERRLIESFRIVRWCVMAFIDALLACHWDGCRRCWCCTYDKISWTSRAFYRSSVVMSAHCTVGADQ